MNQTKQLNWKIIQNNLCEAAEQIENLISLIRANTPPSEEELQIMLCHAYHHMNFAWNARHVESERYRSMNDSDFETWGLYPVSIEDPLGE